MIFTSNLVLVGGLAPRYLVPQDRSLHHPVPLHCGTMDVDLAVSLAVADLHTYASIRETLLGSLGFQPGTNRVGAEQHHSFVKTIGGFDVLLDFLTTTYDGPLERIRQVEENLSAIQVEGLGLALDCPLEIQVRGKLIEDGLTETTLRVCRLVPFVLLKALALENRRERKDAYDLVYVLRHALGSPKTLALEILENERAAPSFAHAIRFLRASFQSPAHEGPRRYANFFGRIEADHAVQAFAAVQEFLQALDSHQAD